MENKKGLILTVVTMVLVAVLLVLFIVSFFAGPGLPSAGRAAGSDDVITVYGQGKISIQPDVAYLTLGVETLNLDPSKAMDDNAAQIAAVMAALKTAGIEDRDIQTTNYSVYQQFDYLNGQEKLRGYEVTNMVLVTINDVTRAGEIIKLTADAGANRFYGIQFDILERQAAYSDALDMALARAQEKADQLAAKTGRSITGIVSISEGSTTTSPYYPSLTNYASSALSATADITGDTISSGQLEITAVVNVVFQLN